jgi:hypothetical protein
MVDDVVGGLTDEHRARIEAALPPDKTMSPEAWADLTEIVVGHHLFEQRRTTYPIKKERARWKRLGHALTKGFAAELRQFREAERRQVRDKVPNPMRANRALVALWEIHCQVEARAAFHAIWSAFSGSKNPYREFLYWGIMRVWTDRLGGELRYSLSPEGLLSGPLVRFLKACLEPVLGDKTPGAGIADIIDRERAARAWVEAEKRRWSDLL